MLSGGGPPVLIIWPRHLGRSVLDSHRAEGEEESAHRRDSSLPHGCSLRLYPLLKIAVKQNSAEHKENVKLVS